MSYPLDCLLVNVSYIHPSNMMVRAYNGSLRQVISDIDVDLVIRLLQFEVTLQVINIQPSCHMLLGLL